MPKLSDETAVLIPGYGNQSQETLPSSVKSSKVDASVIAFIYEEAVRRATDSVTEKQLRKPNCELFDNDLLTKMKRVAGPAAPFAALRTAALFLEEANRDAVHSSRLCLRALFCEVLATRILKLYPDSKYLWTQVITRQFHVPTDDTFDHESAIELAISFRFKFFLVEPTVQRCVDVLWTGSLLLDSNNAGRGNTFDDSDSEEGSDSRENGVLYTVYEEKSSGKDSFARRFNVDRLLVPRNQNAISVMSTLAFLAVFTYTINFQPAVWSNYPTWNEMFLWIFAVAHIFEEIRQLKAGGIFYLHSLFIWFGIIAYPVIIVSLAVRLSAIANTDMERKTRLNEMSYDILATDAIFLWLRCLTLFDASEYFGNLITTLQIMISDGISFFFMLAFSFLGFGQSFYALSQPNGTPLLQVFHWLIRAFLQQPDFDKASEIHPYLGVCLFVLFQLVTSILLFNLLIAIFSKSYSDIMESANQEYLVAYTLKVFRFLKAPDYYPFTPPFNLLEIFFIIPIGYLLTDRQYTVLNRTLLAIFFGPCLFFIALYECPQGRRMFRRLSPRSSLSLEIIERCANKSGQVGYQDEEGNLIGVGEETEPGVQRLGRSGKGRLESEGRNATGRA